ncbi:hypothetical protein PAXRUDRAFT_823297 [Paxillus rubicundulus Ve08.2h10]|uniref:Unplaced genomic scaffold scaffold_53, whole genome shotgun sequence n=1 Tax=Paxillus rubicundulus Ve08.2h10 TaxID=930991 RepID=A0A0D0E3Z0_9AGAM|nr:hypothetical protein PAXRUDRAFT_823297 [Paxillus rubicundulus Ve08.2h10]
MSFSDSQGLISASNLDHYTAALPAMDSERSARVSLYSPLVSSDGPSWLLHTLFHDTRDGSMIIEFVKERSPVTSHGIP